MFHDTESQEEGPKDTLTAGGDIGAGIRADRHGQVASHTEPSI